MSVYFGDTRIENQTIFDGGVKDFTASCRVTKKEKQNLQAAAEAEGLSESDFVRDGLRMRMLFTGDDFYRLMNCADTVKDLLKDEPVPMVWR